MKRTLLVLLPLVLSGCVLSSVRAEHVLTGQPAAPYHGEVRVVMEGAPDPGPFDELGIVTARGTLELATLPAVIGELQRETAAIGGDAVIRVRYDHGANGASATGVAVKLRK